MDPVEALFRAIDRELSSTTLPRVELRIVGSTALLLQTTYRRGTKDSDVVETFDFDPEVRDTLVGLAGPGTRLSVQHGIHLEFVGEAILFLPEEPAWKHAWSLSLNLEVARVPDLGRRTVLAHALGIVDRGTLVEADPATSDA